MAIHRVDEILIGHRELIHIVTPDHLHLSPAAGRQYDEGTSGFHVDALGVCLGAVRIALRMATLGAAEVVVLASGRSDDQTRSQSMLLLQVNKGFDRLRAIGVEHDDVVTDDTSDLVIGMRGPVIMERFGAQSVEPRIPFDRGLLLAGYDGDYIQSIAVPVKCGALSGSAV